MKRTGWELTWRVGVRRTGHRRRRRRSERNQGSGRIAFPLAVDRTILYKGGRVMNVTITFNDIDLHADTKILVDFGRRGRGQPPGYRGNASAR